MDRLISAILNLTREGRREFQPVPIAMRDLIENIASTMAHQAAEAEAQIRVEPLPDIVSDRLALEQIFSNLIDNALKFAPEGGRVRLTARALPRERIEIAVEDSGPGLDPEDRARAGTRFFRADSSRATPGSGLGLSLVQAVARLHGGELVLEEAPPELGGTPGLRATIRIGPA